MKQWTKNYFHRVLSSVSKPQLVYWWIMRGLMIYAFINTLVNGRDYEGSNPVIQIVANFVGMFAFEIVQMFPEKNRFRFFSSSFQNITALGFLLGSFGGAYLNLYYILPGYDKALHAFGTAEAVYIGYEYLCATQLKLKKTCPHQIVTLGALGFGFILSSAWEMFEFTYDQFFGGDAQHWNYDKAVTSAKGIPAWISKFFPFMEKMFDKNGVFHLLPLAPEYLLQRFPIMDTMEDIALNFVGGLIMYGVFCRYPYRHRGKNNINVLIENELKAQEAVVR